MISSKHARLVSCIGAVGVAAALIAGCASSIGGNPGAGTSQVGPATDARGTVRPIAPVSTTPAQSIAGEPSASISTSVSASRPSVVVVTSTVRAVVTPTVTASAKPPASGPTLHQEAFTTPSENIFCMLGRVNNTGVTCDVHVNTWPPGTYTDSHSANCGNYPQSPSVIWMDAGRAPTRSNCFGDTGDVGFDTNVAYGTTVQYGDVSCVILEAGVTCTSGSHGFTINKSSYQFH